MTGLVDLREDFPTDAHLAGLAVREHALGSGYNMDALAAQNGLELIHTGIDPAAGLADALDVADDFLPFDPILELATKPSSVRT